VVGAYAMRHLLVAALTTSSIFFLRARWKKKRDGGQNPDAYLRVVPYWRVCAPEKRTHRCCEKDNNSHKYGNSGQGTVKERSIYVRVRVRVMQPRAQEQHCPECGVRTSTTTMTGTSNTGRYVYHRYCTSSRMKDNVQPQRTSTRTLYNLHLRSQIEGRVQGIQRERVTGCADGKVQLQLLARASIVITC
jgi:hypothetical protein